MAFSQPANPTKTIDLLKFMRPEAIHFMKFRVQGINSIESYVDHFYNESDTTLMTAVKDR